MYNAHKHLPQARHVNVPACLELGAWLFLYSVSTNSPLFRIFLETICQAPAMVEFPIHGKSAAESTENQQVERSKDQNKTKPSKLLEFCFKGQPTKQDSKMIFDLLTLHQIHKRKKCSGYQLFTAVEHAQL